ncbi:Oxygen-dependent coproporphyrinogen-III oxidase [Portunus trituberculatus]|uniref:coproporphyrinogen oxidase n=1 Tax=Portunus trituberculatus TaxID=210409 RepID=A0A5B7DLI1_PORTR|nr:Oxygen-dependent coproporphyrinogen-III oxidase [Portunus trituberculatus]
MIINSLKHKSEVKYIGTSLLVSGGVALYASHQGSVAAAQKAPSSLDTSTFMAAPVTELSDLEGKPHDMRTKMELMIMRIQSEFCRALEVEEGEGCKFTVDKWRRHNPSEGGGVTCVLQDGKTFEKAGVNITVMTAPLSKELQASMRARGKKLPEDKKFSFFAAGISSVIHPRNPHWWFGGGTDLTPYYLDEGDVKLFHGVLKSACDRHHPDYYSRFKKWCDDYFFVKFRGESGGPEEKLSKI